MHTTMLTKLPQITIPVHVAGNDAYKHLCVQILQSIGIVVTKSKETRVVTYTCRYSSGNLIPS